MFPLSEILIKIGSERLAWAAAAIVYTTSIVVIYWDFKTYLLPKKFVIGAALLYLFLLVGKVYIDTGFVPVLVFLQIGYAMAVGFLVGTIVAVTLGMGGGDVKFLGFLCMFLPGIGEGASPVFSIGLPFQFSNNLLWIPVDFLINFVIIYAVCDCLYRFVCWVLGRNPFTKDVPRIEEGMRLGYNRFRLMFLFGTDWKDFRGTLTKEQARKANRIIHTRQQRIKTNVAPVATPQVFGAYVATILFGGFWYPVYTHAVDLLVYFFSFF